MGFLGRLKKKLRYITNELTFNRVKKIEDINIEAQHDQMNIVWIIYDSCRYDSLIEAKTPVLDRYSNKKIYSAWTSGTYTLPAHMSFFTGILPLVNEPIPYLNRFEKQLITLRKAGEATKAAIGKRTIELPRTNNDMIHALGQAGYYTVGSGAATWFAKKCLTEGFEDFQYKRAQSFEEQSNYILKKLSANGSDQPFFAFMNLIETHTPYMHYGDDREEYSMQARDSMTFPPKEDPEEIADKGKKLHKAQIEAAEYIDSVLGNFLPKLPENTMVMIMADHGECFGEDGFWGHGVYHPKVMNVPMACFMLNGEDPLDD